jgi:hypothetical protein
MKKLISIFIFLLSFSLTSFSQSRMMSLDLVPDSSWFDFWIGDWDIYWYGKDSVKEYGENHIKRTLGDKVLLEEFKIKTGANAGFEGKSWSVYNKNTGKWNQTWVDNSAAYLPFTGRKDGQNRIFEQEIVKKDGTKLMQRMVFKNVTPYNFTWDWESSSDEGKTWTNNWQLFYTRMK